MGRWVMFIMLAACRFHGALAMNDGGDDDVSNAGSEGVQNGTLQVAHVGAADVAAMTSTATWMISAATTIDTTSGVANPALPAGVHVAMIAQDPSGPPLFVVQAADIRIEAALSVVGGRPLLLVATGVLEVTSTGAIHASANHATPGPGGAASGAGSGAGGPGVPNGSAQDAGGCGASFGTVGGRGGNGDAGGTVAIACPVTAIYGDAMLTTLEAGSGGGDQSPMCATSPRHAGAGGGAVQLTATSLIVDGLIDAGGGGSEGANACGADGLGGGGGGSGGAIYLQARTFVGAGTLVANGGGGGGTGDSAGDLGDPGDDAHLDTTAAAGGVGIFGDGGAGAALNVDAQPGQTLDNGGGGGGGAGRIVLDIPPATSVAMISSPQAQQK